MSPWPDNFGSDYEPSHAESGSQDSLASPGGSPVKSIFASYDSSSPKGAHETIYDSRDPDDVEDDNGQPRRRRKRRRLTPDLDLPNGRLPFKRMAGTFSPEYLSLLNDDIDDAKERVIADGEPGELQTSQMGMAVWSATEKRLFFDALGRLGADDLPGVSSRVGTKSIVEVAQYARLLGEESGARVVKSRDAVIRADIPAAAEISPQCCLALDAAADEVSLRQQRYEERRERQRWEDLPWRITRETAFGMEEVPEERREPFASLFRLPRWVELSSRVFMNASFAENNWRYVDEEPPSVRSTALEDFHNLAVSITRRIVSAALFCAASRIRSKVAADDRTRNLVKTGDVLAAVESLGLSRDGREFWAGCARRLKLDVYDDDDDEDSDVIDEDGGLLILTFDEVEDALGSARQSGPPPESPGTDSGASEDVDSEAEVTTDSHDTETESAEAELGAEEEAVEEELEREIQDEEVLREARELIFYTALDIPPTRRTIDAVKRRVTTERNGEAYADACDEAASAQEELRMWQALKLEAPEELARKARAVDAARRETLSTDDYMKRGDWKEGLRYVSQWETAPRD